MASPSSGSRGNRLRRVAALATALYAGALVLAQCGLWYARPRLASLLTQSLGGPARIGSLRVTPLFRIQARHLTTPRGSIRRMTVSVRPRLLGGWGLAITGCHVTDLLLDGSREELAQAWQALRTARGPLQLSPRVRCTLSSGQWGELRVPETTIRLTGSALQAHGSVSLTDTYPLPSWIDALALAHGPRTLRYAAHVLFDQDRLRLEPVLLSIGAIHIAVTGHIESPWRQPTAMLHIATTDAEHPAFHASWWQRVTAARPPRAPAVPRDALHGVAGELQASADGVMIKRLSAFVGDLPLGLSGSLQRTATGTELKLQVVSHPERVVRLSPTNPRTLELALQGAVEQAMFRGQANATVGLWTGQRPLFLSASCSGCRIEQRADAPDEMLVAADHITLTRQETERPTDTRALRLPLTSAQGRLRIAKHGIELLNGTARFGGGDIALEGHVATEKAMPQVNGRLRWSGVAADELLALFDAPYHVQARLDGTATLSGEPDHLVLAGDLRTTEGTLATPTLLKEALNFLGIAAPDPLPLRGATASFRIIPRQRCELTQVTIGSPQLHLAGRQIFDAEGRMDGRLSVRVGYELAQTSWKMRLLLLVLGNRRDDLRFDFDVGGLVSAPQLQWREDEFRQQVQRLLPEDAQAKLEREVEQALAALH